MKSDVIGKGVQTFRIKDFASKYLEISDLGPDYSLFLESRKIVKLTDECVYYALIQIPYNTIEEFIIRLYNEDIQNIDWKEISEIADKCRWHGSSCENKYIIE